MAVLIEAYSVVIQADSILKKWPGGWEAFKDDVPNQTLCADGKLIRIGFMSSDDALRYCAHLEARGIYEAVSGGGAGYVIVDQLQGPKTHPDWLEFGAIDKDDGRSIAVCRITGDDDTTAALPEGWKYEGSLSDTPNFASKEEAESRLEKIRRRDGVEVYYDKQTRKQVFVGRTASDD